MDIISEVVDKGVVERRFDIELEGDSIPAIIWKPENAAGPVPVVLIGHGGTQHKRAPNVLALGRRFVRHLGYAAVAIDAPGHGERVTDEAVANEARRNLERRIAAGPGKGSILEMTPEQAAEFAARSTRGVIEWKAMVDVLEAEEEISNRIGYWGLSMGTAIGLPFVASESRVRAAVLGLAGLSNRPGAAAFEQAARRLTIPVLFVFQWDDELMSRKAGLDLFDAFGSSDKAMHVYPGGHVETPLYERDDYDAFFKRHLGE